MTFQVYKNHKNLKLIAININANEININYDVNIFAKNNKTIDDLINNQQRLLSNDNFNSEYDLTLCKIFSSDLKIVFDKNLTSIKFRPNFNFFQITNFDDAMIRYFEKRVYDLVGALQIDIEYNNEIIKSSKYSNYCCLYPVERSELFYHKINDDFEFAIGISGEGFQQISMANGICTSRGGRHVNLVVDRLVSNFNSLIMKQHIKKAEHIYNSLFIFVNFKINNISFDDIDREYMDLNCSRFGIEFAFDGHLGSLFKISNTFKIIVSTNERRLIYNATSPHQISATATVEIQKHYKENEETLNTETKETSGGPTKKMKLKKASTQTEIIKKGKLK